MGDDDWVDTMNEFRNAVYAALEGGATIQDLRDDIDNVEEENGRA